MSLELTVNPVIEFDVEALSAPDSKYTREKKVEAISLFMVTNNLTQVAEQLNIPINTLSNWKNRSPWWDETIQSIRKEKQLELDTLLTNTIHTAVNQLVDRLDNGDYKVDKQGDLHRVPISARDLATTLSIIYEKRALLRGEATAIRTESTITLQSLEDKFKQFALNIKEKDVISTVS